MTERWHPDETLPVIARFEVRRRAYLAPDGSINRQLPAFASDTRLLVRLYRAMVLVRAFDVKAVALQRTGRLGTYAASLGQEAVSVGTASAMRDEDVLLPSYRDNAALIWRGVKLYPSPDCGCGPSGRHREPGLQSSTLPDAINVPARVTCEVVSLFPGSQQLQLHSNRVLELLAAGCVQLAVREFNPSLFNIIV